MDWRRMKCYETKEDRVAKDDLVTKAKLDGLFSVVIPLFPPRLRTRPLLIRNTDIS